MQKLARAFRRVPCQIGARFRIIGGADARTAGISGVLVGGFERVRNGTQCKDFGSRNMLMRTQEIFRQEAGTDKVLRLLHNYIAECTAVVCVMGERSDATCISKREFDAYFAGLKHGFAILFESVKSLKRQLEAVELEEQFGIRPLA